jgi:hypothetical protein
MTACPAETAPETDGSQSHEEQYPWPEVVEDAELQTAPGERKKYDIDRYRASFELISRAFTLRRGTIA